MTNDLDSRLHEAFARADLPGASETLRATIRRDLADLPAARPVRVTPRTGFRFVALAAAAVLALVVMGSMAEKINLLIDGGTRYYSDKVVVTDGSAGTAGF